MARSAGAAARTTLYRLAHLRRLEHGIRDRYLDSDRFASHWLNFQGRDALLIVGDTYSPRASWASRVSQLTGVHVDVGNVSAAGVLLIRDEGEAVWALTHGMGFQMLEHRFIEPAFGQRVAVGSADPEQLRSVTRTVLDHQSRTDRSSIPGGDAPRSFGIGDFGEIVSQVVGSAAIPNLTASSKPVEIKGSNALSVPLAKDPAALLGDLEAIRGVLLRDPLPDLEALEQFAAVKNPLVEEMLRAGLNQALQSESYDRLALSWPQERFDEHGPSSSFRLQGAGRGNNGPFDGLPSFERLRGAILERDPIDPVDAATRVKVQLYDDPDAQHSVSRPIPVLHWLAYEVDLEGSRYCFHDGRWYQLDTNYADRLRKHVDEIFARQPPFVLPEWTDDFDDEAAYNVEVASQLDGLVLDKRLIKTDLHRHGIEACDVFSREGLPIHVKRIPKSSVASHLIAQALVSTDALSYDPEAREAMRARIIEAGGAPELLPEPLSGVVLGLASRRPLSAESLFTFTQVTLARLDRVLARSRVAVYVGPIIYSRGPRPSRTNA